MMSSTFSAQFFTQNRQNLYKSLKPGSFVAIAANGLMQRSSDQPFMLEQEPNFWYLTGITEADWWLLADIDTGQEWLVAPTLEEYQKIFDGSLADEDAATTSGIKQIIDARAGRKQLAQLIASKKIAYAPKPMPRRFYGFYANRAQYDLHKRLKNIQVEDIRLQLARQRAIKQPAEIAAIQHAIDVTSSAVTSAAKQLATFTHEYEFEAHATYEMRRHGLRHAYDPIVASGKNACTLHYDTNDGKINQPFLLFDIGAQASHYAADISRTIPVGQPTKRQMQVFEAVETVQRATIALLGPGKSVKEYLGEFETIMQTELKSLGLIEKSDNSRESIYKWMPHAISHGLGLDVHDSLGRPESFTAGMVITVEPGIYIPEENIGIRIEDDILITAQGTQNLSGDLPVRLF